MNRDSYRRPPQFMSNKFPHSPPRLNKSPFKGNCFGCGWEGHHAEVYYFLMKVKQCLAYMKDNPKSGAEKVAKFRQHSNSKYKQRRAKIRTLQEDKFIPYPDIGPEILLNCIDDTILNEFEKIHLNE